MSVLDRPALSYEAYLNSLNRQRRQLHEDLMCMRQREYAPSEILAEVIRKMAFLHKSENEVSREEYIYYNKAFAETGWLSAYIWFYLVLIDYRIDLASRRVPFNVETDINLIISSLKQSMAKDTSVFRSSDYLRQYQKGLNLLSRIIKSIPRNPEEL